MLLLLSLFSTVFWQKLLSVNTFSMKSSLEIYCSESISKLFDPPTYEQKINKHETGGVRN